MAGGSQIIINKNGITIITPANFEAKAGQHLFKSGEQVVNAVPQLPVLGELNQHNFRYLLKDKEGIPFAHHKYIAFMQNGKQLKGITDENGYTQLINTVRPEEVSIHLYNNEEINID